MGDDQIKQAIRSLGVRLGRRANQRDGASEADTVAAGVLRAVSDVIDEVCNTMDEIAAIEAAEAKAKERR